MDPKANMAGCAAALAALMFASACGDNEVVSARQAGAPRPQAGSLFLYPERIPLEAGGLANAERGVLFVPTNRKKPGSAVISLEVYRFAAATPQRSTPPIFVLYGGPSFEGLQALLSTRGYYERRIRPLLAAGDVVVVSQRGIGPSKPTTLIQGPAPFPLDAVVSDDKRAELVRSAAAREKAFWTSQGVDLHGFTVVEAAADIDDARKALGYERITLWGGSFGSHLAMAVMRFYPATVERAVLRGLEGPDHTYDMPSHVLNSLKRLAAEADAAVALKPHIPPGGLMAAFQRVIERTALEPVVISAKDPGTGATQKVRFDAADVRRMALGYTDSAASRSGMLTWPSDVLALHHGDWREAAAKRLRDSKTERFRTASYYMLDCSSGISPQRRAQLEADPAVATLGPLGFNYRAACPVWDIDAGEAFRQNFETTIPTVLVQGDYDVSTPMENAIELAPFFKNGKLIIVHGGSHPALDDAMDASSDFARAILAFAQTGKLTGLPPSVRLPPLDFAVPPARVR